VLRFESVDWIIVTSKNSHLNGGADDRVFSAASELDERGTHHQRLAKHVKGVASM
jgi:hypothetical protein